MIVTVTERNVIWITLTKKKPQQSGRGLLGLQFKAITREELRLRLSIMPHRSNASAAIKQFTFTLRNDKTTYSRCSRRETSLRIRRGLLGGGPRQNANQQEGR